MKALKILDFMITLIIPILSILLANSPLNFFKYINFNFTQNIIYELGIVFYTSILSKIYILCKKKYIEGYTTVYIRFKRTKHKIEGNSDVILDFNGLETDAIYCEIEMKSKIDSKFKNIKTPCIQFPSWIDIQLFDNYSFVKQENNKIIIDLEELKKDGQHVIRTIKVDCIKNQHLEGSTKSDVEVQYKNKTRVKFYSNKLTLIY